MRCDPNAIIRSMMIINPRDPVTPVRIRSEERHSQDRPCDEFPQDVALVRHPKNVRDIAWKAQIRLCARYRTMVARGKKPTIVVAAVARELAGFVWAIGQEMRVITVTNPVALTSLLSIEAGTSA
jgi:hypothetical protein